MLRFFVWWCFVLSVHSFELFLNPQSGPTNESVFQKKLVHENVLPIEILKNSKMYYEKTGKRNFGGDVLGFIEDCGEKMVKLFMKKFTLLVPDSLVVSPRVEGTNLLTFHINDHMVDPMWLKQLRKQATKKKVKLIVRIIFHRWEYEDFSRLLSVRGMPTDLVVDMMPKLQKYDFDGVYFPQWPSYLSRNLLWNRGPEAIKEIADAFRFRNKLFILEAPYDISTTETRYISRVYDRVIDHVDFIHFRFFGHAIGSKVGLAGPLAFYRRSIEIHATPTQRQKILFGMSWSGAELTESQGEEFLDGDRYETMLEQALLRGQKMKFKYDDSIGMHHLHVLDEKGRRRVLFPTLFSIFKKRELAEELRTGLAIADVGYGLKYFYDVI